MGRKLTKTELELYRRVDEVLVLRLGPYRGCAQPGGTR